MNSFLAKNKDSRTYEEKISGEPKETQRNKRYAVNNFQDFVDEEYSGKSVQDIVTELKKIKETEDQQTYESALYGMLQDWINSNQKHGRGNYTIRVLFSNLRKYLLHFGIKTNEQDIKEYLTFGKRSREERYPLSQEEYSKIVNGVSRNPRLQALFLTLGSSGMRIGEAVNLKKSDLDISGERIKVNISSNTKTRAARSTYISKEAQKILEPILKNLEPDDYVFARKGCRLEERSVGTSLNRALDRIGFDKKYQSNGYSKITTHSFRSYFFTKAARKHGENYAHRMTGHGGYLMQYDRMTEEEKLEMYKELEPELVVFDQTRNELEIKRLQEENKSIEKLRAEVTDLKKKQANQDKLIVKNLEQQGRIPTSNISMLGLELEGNGTGS